jgi:hypothetical protein
MENNNNRLVSTCTNTKVKTFHRPNVKCKGIRFPEYKGKIYFHNFLDVLNRIVHKMKS